MGCPIRKFSDQSLHTAPRNLSQYITSFVAFQCLGIRHTPLFAWFNAQKIIFLSKLNFYLIVQMNEQSDIDIDIKIYNLKKLKVSNLVEDSGIEPLTSWMQIRRSPSWANPPWIWWAEDDSNVRPHPYQGCALTTWATGPYALMRHFNLKEEKWGRSH